MQFLTRLTKWILRLAAYVVGTTLALLVVAIVLGGFTSFGGRLLSGWIAELASTPDRRITISDPGPLLSGRLRVGTVTIADTKGTYATVRDLAVDWTPSALLAGRFRADRIAATAIEIDRQPIVTQPPTPSGAPFRPPLAIDIASVAVGDVSLGSELVGKPVTFSLAGSGLADADQIAAKIEARRRNVAGSELVADLLYAPADDRLRLKATVAEPAGGLMAGLLRLPGEPALKIAIDGDGPLSDWRGTVSADVDGQPTISVTATHRIVAENRRHVTLEGDGQFDRVLPPSLRSLFSGRTRIDVAAAIAPSGAVEIESGAVTSASLKLTASGTFDPAGQNDLRARLSGISGPVALRWAGDNRTVETEIESAEFSINGPASAAALDLRAQLQSLATTEGRLNDVTLSAKSTAFDLAERKGQLDTAISVKAGTFSSPSLNRAVRPPLTIHAPLAFSSGSIGFDGSTIESASVGGKIDGSYSLEGGTLSSHLALFLLPDVLPASVASKFSGTIGLAGDLQFAPPGAVSLDNLKVTSDVLEMSGNGALTSDNQITADLQGKIADIGHFIANTEGAADFTVSASGPLDRPKARVALNATKAKAAGRTLEDLTVELEGTASPTTPTGQLRMSGQLDGQTISGSADLVPANGGTNIPALSVVVGPNRASGSMSFSPQFTPSGELTFDFPDIGLLAALAGQQAAGDLKGNVTIGDDKGRTSLKVVASGSTLSRDGVVATRADMNVAITDIPTLAANGSVRAQSLKVGGQVIETPLLSFTREGSETGIKLEARYDNAPVLFEGDVVETTNGLTVGLKELSAAPRGIPLQLSAPTSVDIVNGDATLRSATLSVGGGTVALNGRAGRTLDLSVALNNIPAALANNLSPNLGAGGSISGTMTVNGRVAAPVVDYTLDWRNAAVAQTRSAALGDLNVNARGRFEGSRLTIDTRTTGAGGAVLTGGGSLVVSGRQDVDLRFAGDLPFATLSGLLSQQGLVLEGTANVQLTVSGNLRGPVVGGRLTTSGARLIDVRRNLTVEALAATVTLAENRATISDLTGRLVSGGTVSGSGTIDIRSPGLPADVEIKLVKAVYVDGMLFHSTVDGTLGLRGPLLSGPVLSGSLALSDTAITVPERLPASLAELDVKHRNAPPAVRAQTAALRPTEARGSSSSIRLDLAISSPSRVFVRGRGIDAELGGSLTLRGTATDPDVSGAFTLLRGRLTVLTKRLDFTRGTITFGGGLIPILDMEATTTSGSTTITVTLSGLANNPQVAFSSSPALPQDEILAQLIFGQSMTRLSALQIAQLADAVGQLAGGQTSLFSSLRGAIGIDNLDITTDERGQAQFRAGKYLNERTYIELDQGADGTGRATINLDVGRGVKLKGEAGGDGSGGAGIFYEKEY
ncbi:translocation/assembly module TamB domain-containing protein [Ciceribacter sp. RN22]|uniref:translocation/assembly module TamB domain-containing protein n=1 Tax=Ciceribacter sp. RN22 TaxID=2954932 RepID=UPI002093C7E0|nr:translocation/assembly module TamB domain-containing protein [Ciceribacter sp. RN22]MCO6180283.1 translocation/assembly module TamB [Ciceribacter sp. RN22]